ncbi:urease accessory protein [Microdochium nivale]|nr:urease accessory protein [Microdochium nivale]
MTQPTTQEEVLLQADLEDEVRELERQLAAAKQRLVAQKRQDIAQEVVHAPLLPPAAGLPVRQRQRRRERRPGGRGAPYDARDSFAEHHHLLLLSDSALPLGSFAFSSGLESYREHARAAAHAQQQQHRAQQPPPPPRLLSPQQQSKPAWSFSEFLPLSLSSYASTTLPFVLAAHRAPQRLAELDDALDAATICTVGRRASCAQGRALLGIWEKSLVGDLVAAGVAEESDDEDDIEDGQSDLGDDEDADIPLQDRVSRQAPVDILAIIKTFSALLRSSNSAAAASASSSSTATTTPSAAIPLVSAHLAPLFGVVSRALGLGAHQAAYIFMLSHVKALVSAAIRAGMFGPFQAQKILAGRAVREVLPALIRREWDTPVELAGQSSPVVDLWIGRHEILYSRVFNS